MITSISQQVLEVFYEATAYDMEIGNVPKPVLQNYPKRTTNTKNWLTVRMLTFFNTVLIFTSAHNAQEDFSLKKKST